MKHLVIKDIHNSWLYCFTNPLELGIRVSLSHRQSYEHTHGWRCESETCVPSWRGFVKQYNQELCIFSTIECSFQNWDHLQLPNHCCSIVIRIRHELWNIKLDVCCCFVWSYVGISLETFTVRHFHGWFVFDAGTCRSFNVCKLSQIFRSVGTLVFWVQSRGSFQVGRGKCYCWILVNAG